MFMFFILSVYVHYVIGKVKIDHLLCILCFTALFYSVSYCTVLFEANFANHHHRQQQQKKKKRKKWYQFLQLLLMTTMIAALGIAAIARRHTEN